MKKVAGYRIISLIALVGLGFWLSSFYAINDAERTQQRGTIAAEGRDYPAPIKHAETLRIGVNVALEQYNDAELEARLADLAAQGVQYVRQEFRWADLEPAKGQHQWALPDRLFQALKKHGLQVLPVILSTPEWARRPTGNPASKPIDSMPPVEAVDYGYFVGAFAKRYDPSGLILGYQIWDEPNLSAAWGNGLVNPWDYHHMLRAASGQIRAVNPSARVILAALAPTVEHSSVNLAPQAYLGVLYDLGSRDDFDVVAAKPYGFSASPLDRQTSPAALNFSHVILMRETMFLRNDGEKSIWITQFGWNALPAHWQGQPSAWGSVSEQQQADYFVQAIQRAAQEWHWLGAMFVENLQPNQAPDHPRWGFALLDQLGRPRPIYKALPQAIYETEFAARSQTFASCNQFAAKGHFPPATCYQPNPLALFSEGWRFSNLGVDTPQREDAQVTIRFKGDALALIVRRDNYRAYTYISIDGKPANLLPRDERGSYLIMTSSNLKPQVETIEVANGLGAGEHAAVLRVDRGWNQWSLVGWSSRSVDVAHIYAPTRQFLLGYIALSALALLLAGVGARWQDLLIPLWRHAQPHIRSARGLLTGIATALIVWGSAAVTWAQDVALAYRNLPLPTHVVLSAFTSGLFIWSPMFVLGLVALGVLFVIVLMRLDVGLTLLAFFIPFFIVPQRLFASAFSMVELLTLMCLVSWAIRQGLRLRDWRLGIKDWRTANNPQSLIPAPQFSIFNFQFSISLLDLSILAFVLVSLASAWQAEYKVEAFRELRTAIAEPAALYLMLRTTQLSQTQIKRIVAAWLLGAVAIAGIGLFNYARGDRFAAEFGLPRIKSIYGSPNNDALYLGRAFAMLLAVAVASASTLAHAGKRALAQWRFWLPTLGLALVTLALVLSQSRGALLFGMPAATIAVCLGMGGKWRKLGWLIMGAGVLGLLMLMSGVAQPLLGNTRLARAFDLANGTGFFRIYLWQSALMMWRDFPLLGVGPDNFLYAYRGFYILPAAWQEPNLSHPHNFFFDFVSRLGTLGLVTGLGIVAGVWQLFRHTRSFATQPLWRSLCIGFAAMFVYMLAHGMVDHSLFLVDLAFVFMLGCGLLWQARREHSS
ncbi:MAG: O-antigen ligase family protein [Anaerolineae bacterium]|nr:O-antigen ligase family protein [Anaerolineae bacterium]